MAPRNERGATPPIYQCTADAHPARWWLGDSDQCGGFCKERRAPSRSGLRWRRAQRWLRASKPSPGRPRVTRPGARWGKPPLVRWGRLRHVAATVARPLLNQHLRPSVCVDPCLV